MQCVTECTPCYLKQVISSLMATGIPEPNQRRIVKEVAKMLPYMDDSKSPAENSSLVLLEAYKLMGIEDPFRKAKEQSNMMAMRLYPLLRQRVAQDDDPLFMALRMSAAGNIIDMGILREFDVNASIDEALSVGFAICHYDEFKDVLKKARSVLIIGDNSGEIVFDKLLVEQMLRYTENITYSVKSYPILNDATMDDAKMVGMDKMAKVIENGNQYLGTVLGACSPEFLQTFQQADLVISKGQGNYESLEGTDMAHSKTFFLFRAKCPWVAARAGVKYMDMVFCKEGIC